jgi:hypothetical protein
MTQPDHDVMVEIRTYHLKRGKRAQFHRMLTEESLSMLHDQGIRVIRFGPSLHDKDSYVLIRAFSSMSDRMQQEEAFYGSEHWLKHYDERVMAMIDIYVTVVISLPESAVAALQDPAALPSS